MPDWTEAELNTATRLWAEGKSGSEIGRTVCKSRNAVIGKLSRLGLRRALFSSPRLARPKKQRQPKRIAKSRTVAPQRPTLVCVSVPSLDTPLVQLRDDKCHWVTHVSNRDAWRPGIEHPENFARYCGLPVASGRYCAEHRHLMLEPREPRKPASPTPRTFDKWVFTR
jgi:hypothetical protein